MVLDNRHLGGDLSQGWIARARATLLPLCKHFSVLVSLPLLVCGFVAKLKWTTHSVYTCTEFQPDRFNFRYQSPSFHYKR